jgi:hypothetical protein
MKAFTVLSAQQIAAYKAWETIRANRRSAIARKAWITIRANRAARSEAAYRAWDTRDAAENL